MNLWGLGVMSPLSLLCHAVRRPAADSASSWQGGGGVASTLPRLWGRTRLGPGASARWRLRRLANGVPPAPGVRTSARRAPLCWCRRATGGRGCPACPLGQQCRTPRRLLHRTRIVCVCILWASVRDVQWGTPPRLHLRSASPVPELSMFHLMDDSHGDLQSRHKPLRLASAHGQGHEVSFGMGSGPPPPDVRVGKPQNRPASSGVWGC